MLAKKSDIVRSVSVILTQRSSMIRALYIVSVASNGPRDEILAEFHQAVGDVLEGTGLSKLKLSYIDRGKVKEELSWLREHDD